MSNLLTIFTKLIGISFMQTLNIEITNDNALQVLEDLQAKDFIKIRANFHLTSSVFPGEPFTVEEFKNFILERIDFSIISLIIVLSA